SSSRPHDRAFHLSRRILGNAQIPKGGRQEDRATRVSERDRASRVLAEEYPLDRNGLGGMSLDQLGHPFEDLTEPEGKGCPWRGADHPAFHQPQRAVAQLLDDPVAGDGRAGVYSQYEQGLPERVKRSALKP